MLSRNTHLFLIAAALICILSLAVSPAGASISSTEDLPAISTGATSPLPSNTQAIDRFVEAQMAKHRIPGIALVVIENGQISYATGYGTAGENRPVTADTPMSIGSITKSFTAVAVLQLVEKGHIELDAPVQSYLPWFRVGDVAASRSITVRHLLMHMSGLSEFGYNRVHHPDTTLEQGVRDLQAARLTAPVGATYQYFQPNYQTLALIIETVTGQRYGDYVAEQIFAPLQMKNSYISQSEAEAAGMAQGYSKLFGYPVARKHPFRQYMLGAGYLISTARDLSHFLIAMSNGGVYEGERILSPASIAFMKSPIVEQEGAQTAIAWGFKQYHGESWEASAGADETFMSQMLITSDQSRGYISLMNQQHILDPTYGEFPEGLTALLLGRQPAEGGISMRMLGLVFLAIFIFAVTVTIRSFFGLRGWIRRSQTMSTSAILRVIAPHFLIPAVLLAGLYRFLGPALFGTAWAFNARYVGLYMLPDIALLMFVAIVPDLIQGLYMSILVVVDRVGQRRNRFNLAGRTQSSS